MSTLNGDARSSAPVCLVTGGASGMGLAVVQHLLTQGWNVAIVDYNAETGQTVAKQCGPQALFIKANVADYEELAAAFARTWKEWKRLDVVFGNAGIGDRINFYAHQQDREDGNPPKPNTAVIDIDLYGPIYCAYLGFHYFRKNPDKAGKIIFTSSMAGIYTGGTVPLYSAAKSGVVGLTRSLGVRLKELGEPITVNCICPGLVHTALTKIYSFTCPEEYITPASTIVKAVMNFIDDDSLTGQAAECSGENIHYRQRPEFSDDKAAFICGGGLGEAMEKLNVRFY
ncbi:hypothetical protein AYO21_06904 [Fonsecaea monophora]|uniref:Uncharacterized protein n=2 Tax=Fonsecaea TaxID=40354 RepID=A0A0D2DJD9_9EURO|nr:uncharacterized protein Z517_07619 [Fonsecaea pedrosoi CBS 271.37]XP_022510825.1 hypothetical protein AYO21_06904 [Fonsecaea monophora]KIW77786.1 hypothetical protein Z517_07619 [Fonsecaea pedrosoi CBS 271.37]OAG38873.1 hypothetical protein AYO21_06904 [Fonsecaea monophora]